MEVLKQLNRQETQEFQSLKASVPSDDKTQELCLSYFLSYKQQAYVNVKLAQVPIEKIPLALQCAFFMAQKSQYIYSVKGQKIRPIGLSLTQLMKNHKLDDIMIMLKDFSKKVKINDEQAQNDINSLMKQISFLITFHSKFQKILQKLQFKERVCQSIGYTKIFSSFIWLLYIQAKTQVLHRSLQLIENTCMLAHAIAFMVIYSWEYIRPTALMNGQKKLTEDSTRKQISAIVRDKILQMFLIKNNQTYKVIAKSLQDFFQQMAYNGVIKISPGKYDFLSPQLINTNYKRLDLLYQKALKPQDLDQRVFFKDRSTNLTPSKFTPFSRQGYANKLVKTTKIGKFNSQTGNNDKENNFTSHRILNYEMIDKIQTAQKTIPVSEMKLPKTVLQTPSSVKVPLICSTPITTGMQMFNYLTQKAKNHSQKPINKNVEILLAKVLQKDKKQSEKNNTKNLKKGLICSLHRYFFDQYLKNNPQDAIETMMISFLGLSIELVFYVSNISTNFQEIETELDMEILQEWKTLDFLLKFDKSMPIALKTHLLDLEINIISFKIWRNYELIQLLAMCANGEEINNQSIQRCFRRILHQIAYQITQMSSALKLEQKISEGIFQIMKQLILNQIQLLENRHIDQLIICSIYANCKIAQTDVKFNQIKEKYEQTNLNNKVMHEELICKVFMEDMAPIDIIKFYNSVFIVNMKNFISVLKEKGINNKVGSRKHSILQSPLKGIIPKQINFKQRKIVSKHHMTPQTQLLYAYNQSPLLKHQFHTVKTPVHSKKTINFEEDQENLFKIEKQQQSHRNDNMNQQNTEVNDFLNRKFAKKTYDKNSINTPMIQLPTKLASSQFSLHPQTTQGRVTQNMMSPLMSRKTPTHHEKPQMKLKICKSPSKIHHHNFANMFERR